MEDKVVSSGEYVMNQVLIQRYEWDTLNWRKLEKRVFKLQKRIYQASQNGNIKLVRKLQRLLTYSTSAKFLAVRKVTQDNRGKKTSGVDGKTVLKNEERKLLAENLNLKAEAMPIRRVWIPKAGKSEKRPLGIPTIKDRAKQALVKIGLEPEWEAKFEPNSYGFRVGRSCHDAIEAIYESVKRKKAYVLDADISGCFDNINHNTLLSKLNTSPRLRRVIKAWLKAGIIDNNVFHKNEKGTPQGGIISPLLANIALHGMENDTKEALKQDLFEYMKAKKGKASYMLSKRMLSIIRYADDFVIIHEDKAIMMKAKTFIEEWLKDMGLELKPSKTRICHTYSSIDGTKPGFDFLGFEIRQYKTNTNKQGYATIIKPSKESLKRHLKVIRESLRNHRGETQDTVIRNLNPIIKGWSRYYINVASRKTFEKADHETFRKTWRWARFRHPHKGLKWTKDKYFKHHKNNDNWRFKSPKGSILVRHTDHKIKRTPKVKGTKSPFDGDFVYWSTRMGRYPETSTRTASLLKYQQGKCKYCKLYFKTEDIIETHHINGDLKDNSTANLALLHGHCHDNIHRNKKVCM